MVLVGNKAYESLKESGSEDSGTSSGKKFTSLKSGNEALIVKALPPQMIAAYDSYGIFGKVNSFEADPPSIKNARGYAVEKLTPWDLAANYYQEQANDLIKQGKSKDSEEVQPLRNEAAKYRAQRRYIVPFVELSTGELIYIDFSKNQVKAINPIIEKQYEKGKLNNLAFELEKTGKNRDTVVSLTPVIYLEDLTAEQQKNLKEIDIEAQEPDFDGLTFTCDESQQIEKLAEAGFDLKLINLEQPTFKVTDEDLPF